VLPAQLDREIRLDVVASTKAKQVWIDWRTPPWFDAGDAELDLAARALAGTRIAALQWTLVDQKKIASAVTARQMSSGLASDFRITVTLLEGGDPDEAVAAVDRVLGLVARRGFTDAALNGARANMIVPYIQSFDRAVRRGDAYASLFFAGRDATSALPDVGRYDAANLETVRAAVAQWLPKGRRVVTVISPDAGAPVSGVLRGTRGGS
jgi:predicted Zn-dependent peptidase